MCQDHAHHHHQHHRRPEGDSNLDEPSLAEKNRDFWDSKASTYDDEEWAKQLIQYTSDQLVAHLGWLGLDWVQPGHPADPTKEVRLLDYACGPGPVSAALAPYCTSILGLDISPAMIARYNARFSTSTIPTTGQVLDLVTSHPTPSHALPQNFDLATVGYALHHVSSPSLALQRLASLLKPGTGTLLIIDVFPFSAQHMRDTQHEAGHTIHKHGFDEAEMRELMEGAGLVDFGWSVLGEKVRMGSHGEQTVFFAKGRRAKQ